MGTLGESFVVTPALVGANLSRALARLQIRPSTSARFVHYWVQSKDFRETVALIAQGSAQKVLNLSDLGEFPFPLLSLGEQRGVVAFLDRKTAAIDDLIKKKERLIELLQEKRQVLVTQAVTKGLNPKVPMKDVGKEWIGSIPAHWQMVELRRLARDGTSITYGIVQAGPHVEGGVPYIRTSDMSGEALPLTGYPRTSREIDSAYRRSKVEAGDVVVAIRATVGKALPVPPQMAGANLTQGTAKVAPGPGITTAYLLYALRSSTSQQRFAALAKGATFKEITLDMLRRFPIPVPPCAEQNAIAERLMDTDTELKQAAAMLRQTIARLAEYRQALISAAVIGQLDLATESAENDLGIRSEAQAR